ncbi:2-amino-4-hydroxy-6-hydroxymethyldihydropteridine diphosphokinase [Fictibacillus aquaticus]|uniref:2-amino-4-hydroxy-6-hydroxymethyldihydropteridine diphosphokinase n=1 Tax=Fictibacillus aquaticus TaxID=2021314 RepID=A0A235F7M6_9BACL|nr:2-amino-4-hydroxy-6-hydroxymethyldihydropteridine diphosphokinase [Fictibacillus aquaticus]OYD56977.1 2-amino-4-hydroxy-6-hydroxymethyldihydropteridine diphosphokinase [Fictibacillus aquaticus]
MNSVYISAGSNLGDREAYLIKAIELLDADPDISVQRVSPIYETDPVGYTDQPAFLNLTLLLKTNCDPHQILAKAQEIELKLERKRKEKWGPRTLDLDILLYNSESIQTGQLNVPHPRMHERSFVLIPLSDIASDLQIPGVDMSISEALCELKDKEGVRIWKKIKWEGASGLTES